MTPNKLKEEPIWMEEFNKMNERLKNTFSLAKMQEEILCKRLMSDRDKALEELVRVRLYNIGYKFRKDELFYSFVRNRITRIGFDDQPDFEYLYLDYISEENKGVLLVTFSNQIEYNYDNFSGKITMSIS